MVQRQDQPVCRVQSRVRVLANLVRVGGFYYCLSTICLLFQFIAYKWTSHIAPANEYINCSLFLPCFRLIFLVGAMLSPLVVLFGRSIRNVVAPSCGICRNWLPPRLDFTYFHRLAMSSAEAGIGQRFTQGCVRLSPYGRWDLGRTRQKYCSDTVLWQPCFGSPVLSNYKQRSKSSKVIF